MNEIEYLQKIGFAVEGDGKLFRASGALRQESFQRIKDSLGFYGVSADICDGIVNLRSKDLFFLALIAGEIREIESSQKEGIEALLCKYPCTLEEICEELCLSKSTTREELNRLVREGFAYRAGKNYVHKAFTPCFSEELLPLAEAYKLNMKYSAQFDSLSQKSDGRFGELAKSLALRFERKAFAYKAALMSSLVI